MTAVATEPANGGCLCDVEFDDDGDVRSVELERLAPVLLVRYAADGYHQECVSARELHQAVAHRFASCTVLRHGYEPSIERRRYERMTGDGAWKLDVTRPRKQKRKAAPLPATDDRKKHVRCGGPGGDGRSTIRSAAASPSLCSSSTSIQAP